MKNKAIFLDRDGVINKLVYQKEEGIIDTPFSESQLEVAESVPDAILKLRNAGYKIIIVSNQPGIAKGYYTKETFEKIQAKMRQILEKKGAIIDDEFYCLHHPDAKNSRYRKKCSCRKPGIGMITKATKTHKIDIKNSFFVGDGMVDLQAAKKIGCPSILIGNVNSTLTKILSEKKLEPVYIAHDLKEAAEFITRR